MKIGELTVGWRGREQGSLKPLGAGKEICHSAVNKL